MTQTHATSLSDQARQGSPRALAQLINSALAPKNITVKVSRDSKRLTIIAAAKDTPNQESLVGLIRRGIKDLDTDLIDTIRLCGRNLEQSSTVWSDEIILKPSLAAQTSVGGTKAGQPQASADFLTRMRVVLSDGMSRLRKIRLSQRTAYGLGGLALLVLVSFVSVVGFHTWQAYANRSQTISKAETLYKEASDTSKAMSVADLTKATEQLKQAGLLLQGIPPSAGSFYQTAQTDLEKTRTQIQSLEQCVKVEEAATTTVTEADRAAQESINTFKNSVKLAEWKTASGVLQKAISQLEAIPQESFVAEPVKAKLANYRGQAAVITKAIGTENNAVQSLEAVDDVAQQAMDLTASKSEYTIADLQTAQAAWQRALKLLKTIPAKSVAAAGIESRRSLYMENSDKLASSIKELQQCLKTSAIKETCGSLSLELSQPPTSRLNTPSTADPDPFAPSSF